MTDDEAPGWNAIDEALATIYGSQVPRHIGYTPGLHLGSGLQGCSAYDAVDHWHYVTYGLTELWAKEEGSDPSTSGWGYEMTIRVAKDGGAEAPPWPFDLLETIARHTHTAANPFYNGHRLDPGGPITGEAGTSLTAIAFTADPLLPPIDTPNGRMGFLQLVGITAAELAEMKATSTAAVLDRLHATNPLLVTDVRR